MAGDDVLGEDDVERAAVLRVGRRRLVGDDADAKPRHEVLGRLARVEGIGVRVGAFDDGPVQVAKPGCVGVPEQDLAADIRATPVQAPVETVVIATSTKRFFGRAASRMEYPHHGRNLRVDFAALVGSRLTPGVAGETITGWTSRSAALS